MITASSSSSFFSASSVCMPSMPGIITSTMAASNGTFLASSTPSSPLEAKPHGIALALQQGLEDLPHDFFVVNDQD